MATFENEKINLSLIDLLDLFNRKERYHLLRNALKSPFQLGEEFATKLGCAIDVNVPTDAWVAMDYHLDWIVVAVEMHQETCSTIEVDKKLELPNPTLFKANQQDIDLVVAFEHGQVTHLVLIEAKAYEQKWTTTQLNDKLGRVHDIFTPHRQGICPHFVLTSPCPGAKSIREQWKREHDRSVDPIKQIHYVKLCLPPRYKITRESERANTILFKKLQFR